MDRKEIDDILFVLDNPLRRKILELLLREDHYPLQLARVLKVSQQSILKHLKLLEEYGFVTVRKVKSDLGGPERNLYSANKHFSVTIDMGYCSLETHIHPIVEDAKTGVFEEFKKDVDALQDVRNVKELQERTAELISRINSELENLEQRRRELILLKDKVLRDAITCIAADGDYLERCVLFHMLMNAGATFSEVSETLDLREEIVRSILRKYFG